MKILIYSNIISFIGSIIVTDDTGAIAKLRWEPEGGGGGGGGGGVGWEGGNRPSPVFLARPIICFCIHIVSLSTAVTQFFKS